MPRTPAPERSRRGVRDYALVIEAAACLAIARVALATLPFERIRASSHLRSRGELIGAARQSAIEDVRWAIGAAGSRLPGSTLCFPRALAAQAMLRRRHVATTLTFGARVRGDRFDAHVWLSDGSVGVVGHEIAPEYATLATPNSSRP